MARTRDIKTNQQDISCDVCGRTLLRGERPEAFLAGGARRQVCELCTARAQHEGWIRESGADELALRSARHEGRTRSRRARSRSTKRVRPSWRAPRSASSSAPDSRIQPSCCARAVQSSHTWRREPPARNGSACSPRSSVRPHTSQETAGALVEIDLRVAMAPA